MSPRRQTLQIVVGALGWALAGCGPSLGSHWKPDPSPAPKPAVPVPAPRDDGRLPSGVHPTRYHLELTVDPADKSFFGRARIGIEVSEPTRAIVLHAKGPKILTAAISTADSKQWAHASTRRAAHAKDEDEELVLTVDHELGRGRAELDLQYEAPFGPSLSGLYRVTEAGKSYAFTQFEPNDARRAFPCFDEPGFKVPVQLNVTVPEGNIVVANTPEISRHENESSHLTSFEFSASPPLPTYLVAFAVGPFEVRQGARDPVPIRLIALPGKTGLGTLALEAARDTLALLTSYFGVPYPYAKLDIVAVPEFGAGAMENAGLVTFREELLLLDDARASTDARRSLAGVMAHELAHQWFGNLVTPKWWDDIWLNEAFATWMGGKIVNQWKPGYGIPLERVSEKQWVMGMDSLASARKIRQPVHSTSEALESFDGITYVKGSAVLGMVERWLGEQAFRQGIQRYLGDHRFGNATSDDLFAALEKASGNKPVSRVMASFVEQAGVPLITLGSSCKQVSGGKARVELSLTQKEYHPLGAKAGDARAAWTVPVCPRIGDKQVRCELLTGPSQAMSLEVERCPDYIQPDADELGYYRYQLSRDTLRILGHAPEKRLSPRERVGVLGDAWALVKSGELDPGDYLAFIEGFAAEDDNVVWDQILSSIQEMERALATPETRPKLAARVAKLFGPVARRVGWEPKPGESDTARLLRKTVLSGLGLHGDDAWAQAEAKKLTSRWLADPKSVSADVAEVAIAITAQHGDAALFEQLLARMKQAELPEERLLALGGMVGFDDPALVTRALALTLDGTIKGADLRYVFPPLFARPQSVGTVHAWLREHFDELRTKLPTFVVGRLPWVAAGLCDEARVHEVEAFFRPRLLKIEGADKHLDQAVEAGLLCAALRAGQGPRFASGL